MATERKTQFNFSRWPSEKARRLGPDALVQAVHDTGPEWAKKRYGVEATATFLSESGTGDPRRSDPRAYLARVQLPKGDYFLVDGNGATTYRTAGYEEIRKTVAMWPSTLSLSSARARFLKLGCEITSSDRGICQNNEDYDPVPDRVAFSLPHNLSHGYQTFLNRDKTFTAWYANVNGLHKRFMPTANQAWERRYG